MKNRPPNTRQRSFWCVIRIILETIAVCLIIILLILCSLILSDSDSRLDQLRYCGRQRANVQAISNILSPFILTRQLPRDPILDTVYIQANGSWHRIGKFNGDWQQFAVGQFTSYEYDLITQPFHEDGSVDFTGELSTPGEGEYIYDVESMLKPAARHYSFTCPDDAPGLSPHCALISKLFE